MHGLAPRGVRRAAVKPIRPMLATLFPEPFDRPGWVYEEKYDGQRAIAYVEARRVRLLSRGLKDMTDAYPEIVSALRRLEGAPLALDGEIVAFDARGVSRFQLLQRHGTAESVRPVFAVFDCLVHRGTSLLRRPLSERRSALAAVLRDAPDVLRLARRLPRDGLAAYRTAKERDWEGIIAKDESSPYEPGQRSRDWLKVKLRKESEFVIGGFTPPSGARTHFGALLVGLYDGPRLRFTGKVGAGFSAATLADLAARMRRLRTAVSPFEPAPRFRDVTWVKPELVAQIAFAEWTSDGKLRQPTFLGLRDDKSPRECTWSARE